MLKEISKERLKKDINLFGTALRDIIVVGFLHGDERISTGVLSYDKRAAVRNRFKSRNFLKLNDNNIVAKAA